MKVGSLFSGIGGLELALESFGHEVEWQAECDSAALAVLAHHWPNVRRYKDVREIDANATRVDVVCGGFPCQPHSLAGRRRGTSDSRWLWPEFARIIEALSPRFVFIENVPGLRTSGLRAVLQDLADLGFDAEWDYFFAAEAGAPHRRQRLYLLAYSDGLGWRDEPGRTGGSDRPGAPLTLVDGTTRATADAGSLGAGEPNAARAALGNQRDDASRGAPLGRYPEWVSPNANHVRQLQPGGGVGEQWRWFRNADGWTFESPVSGVDDGTPGRLDRERLCGNAVVWQQAALAWETLTARATRAHASERAA